MCGCCSLQATVGDRKCLNPTKAPGTPPVCPQRIWLLQNSLSDTFGPPFHQLYPKLPILKTVLLKLQCVCRLPGDLVKTQILIQQVWVKSELLHFLSFFFNQAIFQGLLLRLVSPDLYALPKCISINTHTHTLDYVKLPITIYLSPKSYSKNRVSAFLTSS